MLAVPFFLMLLGHFVYESKLFGNSLSRRKDALILIVVPGLGITIDTMYGINGVYNFPNAGMQPVSSGAPLWLWANWIAFSLTLTRSLSWLSKRRHLFVLLCSIVGPISYFSGKSLGVIDFRNELIMLVVLEWFVVGAIISAILSIKSKA